jgi:hypothetical protein
MGKVVKLKPCPQVHPNGERCILDAGHEGGHKLPDAHRCHVRGCSMRVKPEMLMCRHHWFRVPAKIQRAVWAAYRRGQCDDMSPSEAWHEAADAAIGYVATLDDEPVLIKEINALKKLGYAVVESDGKLRAVVAGKA